MTGRERVKRTLQFEYPGRVPRDLWALPAVMLFQKEEYEDVLKRYPLDIGGSGPSAGWGDDILQLMSRTGPYQDDWGSIWHVGEPGVSGEVKQPALADWAALEGYVLLWRFIRERDTSNLNRLCATSDSFVLANSQVRPFERL